MKFKQIVFDVDGTLLDTEYAVLHSLQEVAKELLGVDMEIDSLRFSLGNTGRGSLEHLGIRDIPAGMDLWNRYLRKYDDDVRVFDGMEQLLQTLTCSGYELGIVTSRAGEEFEHDFARFGIRHFFRTIIRAEDTLEHKPMPAPLFKYMERTGTQNHELLYIGDSQFDVKCARGADVTFALAGWGSPLGREVADYYLNTPLELLDILD